MAIMDLDALYNDDSVEDYEYPWQYLNNRQVSMLFVNCIFIWILRESQIRL